ncbi:pilus assembly protein TadG-related protein [Achromobacter xylosoxidans]|uniref:pilus assembly protein TadG-related protein n=1 Tax=Alcaligenes xylosoxydans xylosoxydans TaxID=85698 RepID=UPI0022B8DA5C|nr:pilus assembly protein TadG-related protein [Achromobacter xylosoxidans]MCZ8390062.1 pilus assembly protein TadG-related protein [Achromobacter xylosoxidans]
MPATHFRPAFCPRQRGSMTVAIVFAVIVGLVLLGVAQLGYAYYMKREMQKATDLAALSAVQVLGMGAPADCTRAQAAGQAAVLANVPNILDTFSAGDVTVECKLWDTSRPDASGMYLFDPASGQVPNALRITLNKTLSSLLPAFIVGGTPVQTISVAANTQPVAVFTVGSRLLRLQKGGLLSQLLATVGATPAQLDILDAAGLATVNITPSGLLEALGLPVSVATGVGTPAQLAALNNLTLGQLLQATLTVMNKAGNTAGASLGLLTNAINVVLNVMPVNLPVKLFGDGGVLDLNVISGDINSALQANINALNVLETALVIANGQNLVNLGLNVPLLGVQSQVRIVEPPSIGVGGVGTQATSAGIRVYLRANTSNIPLVGPLLANTLGTKIDLPIIIDVAQSTGTVSKLCQAPLTESQATIDVTSSVANICLGRFPGMSSAVDNVQANFLSITNSCQPDSFAAIQRYQVLNVLGILPLTSKVTLPIFNSTAPVSVTLTEPPSPNSTATVNATSINLGALASNLADAVVGGILGDLIGTGTPLTPEQRASLATTLVGGGGNNPGKSISQVVNDMQWSSTALNQLGQRMSTGGLTGVLGGTLQLVGNILNSLLLAPLSDVTCLLAITPDAIRQCRVNAVSTLALSGGNQVGGVLSIVVTLLQPLLGMLSSLLQQLLDLLGLSVGQTDVSLLSVDCGKPRLVY